MIKRYFYIFSTTLFILLSPTTGIKAETLEKRLDEMERHQKAPPGFNYQAALRDAEGEVLANTEVTLQFSIQTAVDGGTVHWVETNTVITNAQGLVSVVIGEGTQTGGEQTAFDAIPFGDSDMFLKVDVDTGSGFTTMGTEQLQSVPYAVVAENGLTMAQTTKLDALDVDAEPNVQADWNETDTNSDAYIQNKPSLSGSGAVQADWAVTDMNSEAYIANKPDLSNFDQNEADDFDGAFGSLTGVPSGLADGDDVNDADANATNELQSLDFTDQVISISGDPAETPTTINLSNFDQDATDDFDGAFLSLSGVPESLDTDATDDLTTTDLAFTTAANLTSNSNGDLANDSFLFGGTSLDDDEAITNDNNRMFFNKIKGAFRAGGTNDDDGWNNDNVGQYSFATGNENKAYGLGSSIAGGGYNRAYGNHSSIPGGRNLITQSASETVIGQFNSVSGGDAENFVDTDPLFIIGNGTSPFLVDRTNALEMLKNGNTRLNGTLTLSNGTPGNAPTDGFTLPNTDGTDGQILATDGAGSVSWQTAGGAFSTAGNITSNSAGGTINTTDSFVFGSTQMENVAGADDDIRMFFDKDHAIFRVGIANGNEWDQSSGNAGDYSFAVGSNNIAAASSTFVSGNDNTVSDTGFTSTIAGGSTNDVTGNRSFIGAGTFNSVTANHAFIGSGTNNNANGYRSFVGGGALNTADGARSFVGAGGYNNTSGEFSVIPGGRNLTAETYAQTSMGLFNTGVAGDAIARQDGDRLLVIGNGSDNANRSDAMTILKDGTTTFNGTLTLANGTPGIPADDGFTIPNTDGTNGQVLKTDGTGAVSWQADNGSFAITATNLISNVGGDLANDSFLFGGTSMENNMEADDDSRMFFDKTNAAFRVGRTTGNQWSSANRGLFSFAAGVDNVASGLYSTIGGGATNNASGTGSSIGGGLGHFASGYLSTIPGGESLYATSWGEVALGVWNTNAVPINTSGFDPLDRLLVVGNGTYGNRSDALVMLKNGDTDINGALVSNSLGVDGAFTLPTADGFPTDVMQAAGGGVVNWVPEGTITSDKRLKTNIRDLTNVLEQLSQLDGYRFNWNEIRKNRDREEIGLIAQEVQELYPELVFTDPDGYLRVKYISFVPLLLEAVKELEERNAKLVAENDTLEARQSKDEERFSKLEGQLKLLMQQMTPAEAVGKD